ncbi:MAG TPA: M20/M25/M40 family metallo-hydrolase [Gemmatimonadales bacterium]|nr:M20/M25/M40 family metallo-hydrolase [Gemmatimonadales bacterium]
MRVLTVILLPLSLAAQQIGFSPAAGVREDSIEQRLIAIPDTQALRLWTHDLGLRPHMAGTPAQAVTRDYVLERMKQWGLDTWSKAYDIYMPQPDTVAAWVIARPGRTPERLNLAEPAIPGDSSTIIAQVPPFNGYTGDGDVTAEVVYVNYGLIEDYKTLDSLGVSVKGKIAVARYGRSFRGIKAREAERHGAVGLVMYSDPQDDGFVRGDVYPRGPMRPAGGIQRGSILNENGDPATPGYASVEGAHRLPEDSMALPRIPVIPMSYGNAQRLLDDLGGPSVPQSWQGGLAFRYHTGPGATRLHLKVKTERGARAVHTIWDTFGAIRGAERPDEWVVIGGHRDAWGPGAQDNVSGTVTVMAAAQAFAELAKQGIRPSRTVIFATWDAEEWGLIGSTEWVEEMADSLDAHVVAYINEDAGGSGTNFGGAGSPALKPLLKATARAVPSLTGEGTVYDAWLKQNHGDSAALTFGNMGGGSDFAGFQHHLGIASAEMGFGAPAGVYHSVYDDYAWMTKFGDPGYRAHQALARLVSVAVARIANAQVLPFDYAAFGDEMGRLVSQLDSGIVKKGWQVSTEPLKSSLQRFAEAGRAFARVRDSVLAAGGTPGKLAAADRDLMQVERRLTRPQGLVSRSWYRSLEFASDVDNGYANMAFPSVNEAIRYADAGTAEHELSDLAARVDQARQALEQAAGALR